MGEVPKGGLSLYASAEHNTPFLHCSCQNSQYLEKLFYVQRLIKSHVLDEAPPTASCVMAFREGLSIRDTAQVPCNKAILVKFDFKDFFPSISFSSFPARNES